MESFLR